MDFTLIGVVLSPFILAYSFKSARTARVERHRKIQTGLFLALFCAVILFETDVRISSQNGAFIQNSPWVDNLYFNLFLGVHISVAVATFAGWLTLGIASYQAYQKTLPGRFSANHKRFGRWIFRGLIFTAVSGSMIYLLAFVF